MKLVHYLEECNGGCNGNASLGYGSPNKSSSVDGRIETEGTLVRNGNQETKYGLHRLGSVDVDWVSAGNYIVNDPIGTFS